VTRLRSKGLIGVVDRKDLLFTPSEVQKLFAETFHHPLAADQVDQFYEKTDGWVTALQLIQQSLDHASDRVAAGVTNAAILEWLNGRKRDAFPTEIDCETNSPTFASCYWIQMTKFDAAERNDVLPATVVRGGSGASLDLGGFGYKLDDPGPGVLVSFLPEKYNGPLKLEDRIVMLDGRPLEHARQYAETMSKQTEERTATVMVQRGNQRNRVETRIVIPRRDSGVTARVAGKYLPAERELQVVSCTVKEMKLTVPEHWAGSKLYWNGLVLEKIETAGCWLLTIEKELLRAARCQ